MPSQKLYTRRFSIRSFGSWGEAGTSRTYPAVDVGGSFSIRSFGSWGEAIELEVEDYMYNRFSIRSFGSWGEADRGKKEIKSEYSFSIRSFGSWGEAAPGGPDIQRPGYRFSIRSFGSWGEATVASWPPALVCGVSVSALSDRGVRPPKP